MPGSRLQTDDGSRARGAARMRTLPLRQAVIVLLLFGGYAALYFCRADLSVASPLLIDDLAHRGVTHDAALIRIGGITSLGVLAYALGKLFLGGLGDFWGGRISFLIGLGGATAFTLLFTTTSFIPVFSIAWFGNRLTQSVAWAGLLKVSGKWFDFSSYGTIIGILSISYLVGDAVARQSMGLLIEHGVGWRTLFYLAAGIAAVLLLLNWMFLRESRVDAGYAEALPNPLNLYADAPAQASLVAFLLPLFKSRAFLLVCLLSLGCTIVRETFNSWTPVYLHDHLGYGMSKAARMSAVFPAVGAVSVLLSGWLSDRLGTNGRAVILLVGLCATAVALWVLTSIPRSAAGTLLPLLVVGAVAFCLLGPYSYLGGAFALDFGGKRATAVASGLIDGIGYLGAVVAGDSVARASVAFGWQGVFVALSGVSAIAALGAAGLLVSTAKRFSPAKGLSE